MASFRIVVFALSLCFLAGCVSQVNTKGAVQEPVVVQKEVPVYATKKVGQSFSIPDRYHDKTLVSKWDINAAMVRIVERSLSDSTYSRLRGGKTISQEVVVSAKTEDTVEARIIYSIREDGIVIDSLSRSYFLRTKVTHKKAQKKYVLTCYASEEAEEVPSETFFDYYDDRLGRFEWPPKLMYDDKSFKTDAEQIAGKLQRNLLGGMLFYERHAELKYSYKTSLDRDVIDSILINRLYPESRFWTHTATGVVFNGEQIVSIVPEGKKFVVNWLVKGKEHVGLKKTVNSPRFDYLAGDLERVKRDVAKVWKKADAIFTAKRVLKQHRYERLALWVRKAPLYDRELSNELFKRAKKYVRKKKSKAKKPATK